MCYYFDRLMQDVELGCWCTERRKNFENQEEERMKLDGLNLEKRYFVAAGEYRQSVLASWANENTIKLKSEEMALDVCKRAYELDMQYNDDLRMDVGRFGVGYSSLLNGERTIGRVKQDAVKGLLCVLIEPEIRDR